MTYRLKLPCDGFGCIMASYTSQHEIDIQQLREKGLFGTLLHEGGRIRFLCGPECAVLMMPCVDTFIPSNRRLHMKILGNAIATAHASFLIGGMIYILGSHREQFITPTQMILDTLKTRLHFGNAEVIKVEDGWILQRKSEIPLAIDCDPYEVPISPTMGEPKLIKTVITCGEWKITGWVETQFCATEILQFFGVYEDGLIAWFLRTSDKITIVLKKPFLTPLTLINWSNPASVGVMVFCRGEFVLMKRTENMSNREVLDIIGNHTDIRIKNMCLCNILGKRTCEDDVTVPVSMLISSCIDQSACWHSTLPEFEKKSGCITASMPIHEYQRFVSILKTFGIDQFVAIWGWHVKTSNTMTGSTIGYIHFQRSIEAFVLTTEIFNDMLAMWILRLVLPPVDALDIHRPVDVTIRFYGVCLWNGTVDGSWTLDMLCSSWNSTMKAFNKDCEIRNVVLGKRHNYEDVLETMLPENSQSMRISWVLPVHGGGAKDENRFVAKNRLASLLLLHGVPLAVVADYAENVIKSISPWKLLQELAKGENTKNWIAVKEWLHKMGHPVPSSDHNLEVAARKIQNAIRKRKDLPIQKISASQVNIIPDHFLRHGKTPAVVLKTLMDAKTGVILLDSQEALPWINSDKHLSSDSLACIVLGHTCTCDKKDSCNKVSVPILDAHQQPALVAGCMHQLGSKPILLPQENNVNIAMDKSQIMCFTIYKDECDTDFWKCVMQNPVKSVIQVIKEHCDSMFMTCSPWGRSWRDGKDNSTIEDATSFQFHAGVKQDCVDSIMQISGRGPVYCTPKSEDKGLLEGWAVIWLKAPKRDILIQASKMSIQHAGLVRTLKGMGVRVAQKDFDATFKILRPSDKPPPSIAAKYLYKLQPLPSGMTAENVQEFTTSKGWETRPMRALGRASWLVASEKESPQTWLSLNGKLVLVKEIQQSKPRDPPIILAGKVAIDSKSKQDVPRLTDPWLQQNEDPWLKYQPTQHTPSVASGSSASTVQHSMTDPSLAKRLKEQDDKITSLQSSLQDMKKIQQKQEIDNKTFQSDLDMRLKTMKAEVSDQFNGLSSKFEGSLQAALARQDSQINAGFSELKSLFMQSRGCSEENKSKKPKKGTGKGNDHDIRVDSDQEVAPSPAKWVDFVFLHVLVTELRYQLPCKIHFDDIANHMSICFRTISLARFDFLLGIRVGEATNPGPNDFICSENFHDEIKIVVINPTAVHEKHQEIFDIDAHCYCLAETSATSTIQKEMTFEASKNGYTCFWSAPVQSRQIFDYERASLRGESLGTCCITNLPCRMCPVDFSEDIVKSAWLSHNIIRIGSLDVLVIVFYGTTGYTPESRRANDYLLASAFQLMCETRLPTIVAGDFNIRPEALPSWNLFRDLGFVDAFHFFEQRWGYQLPPTCNQKTRHDTILIPKIFATICERYPGSWRFFPLTSILLCVWFLMFRLNVHFWKGGACLSHGETSMWCLVWFRVIILNTC